MKKSKVCIIIPAYNEEQNLSGVIAAIKKLNKNYDIILVNDASVDRTLNVAEKTRVIILDLPINLGIGGAIQTGLKYALDNNYACAVQLDADGQHDPKYIPTLLKHLDKADMVIGSRYIHRTKYKTPLLRMIGIKLFSQLIYLITKKRIYDATSGYKAMNKNVIAFFSENFPQEFPDAASRVSLLKNGYKIKEVSVEMHQRSKGHSSVGWLYAIYLLFSISISILLETAKMSKKKI
jgi:glycosyltransferase involved in cell wall biosynthesis